VKRLLILLLVFVCATAYAGSYTGFSITNPINDQGVRANDGNVTIHMSLQPTLRSGHMIVLNVEGEGSKSSKTTSDLTIELNNMSRGLHTITATVIDELGNGLIKPQPVSFHVLRVGGG
jgi:hypothetical protein